MKWLNDALWMGCRILGYGLQLVGCTGILAMCLYGIWVLAGRIE